MFAITVTVAHAGPESGQRRLAIAVHAKTLELLDARGVADELVAAAGAGAPRSFLISSSAHTPRYSGCGCSPGTRPATAPNFPTVDVIAPS
ncbi:MAG: hypothetical protein ACRDRO_22050 [Pseudonocardiaceae bacterium]